MQVGSWKFTPGTKQLKSRNINPSASKMLLTGNKKKVKSQIISRKKKKKIYNSNVMHSSKIIWDLAHTNTEQLRWKTAASFQRADRISPTSEFLQVTPLCYTHIWTEISSERTTLCMSEITILLQSTAPKPFLSKDPELLWHEDLTDYYYKA